MKLPVKLSDLPTVTEDMPEGTPFEGRLKSLVLSDNLDKNDRHFLSAQFVIVAPDEWIGKQVADNYIAVPNEEDLKTARGSEIGERLARLGASCKHAEVDDTDDLIGEVATFTVKMEEYQGRKMAKVDQYYI